MQRHDDRPWRLWPVLGLALLLAACGNTGLRLSARFDGETPGAAPSPTPAPTPRNDYFTWGARYVTSRVEDATAPNRRVRVEPNATYFAERAVRATVLQTYSDAMSGSPGNNLRGAVQVTMRGSGQLVIAFFSGDQQRVGGPLGGFRIVDFGTAHIAYLTAQDVRRILNQPTFAAGVGTFLANYTPGTPVDLRWSFDQASRTFSFGAYAASGAAVNSYIADALAPDGVPNTPVRRIWIDIALYDAAWGMLVFLDNISVEEIP